MDKSLFTAESVCPKCGKVCAIWKVVVKHVHSGPRGFRKKVAVDVPAAAVVTEPVAG